MATVKLELSFDYHRAALICIAFLLPLGIGITPLFDWDEINFAEIAREMLITKNYLNVQLNFQPFWEKPPLFFWLQALSQKLFGVNEFASRLPNAIVGAVSIFYLYAIGKKHFNARFGFLWALAYVGSFLPHFYFKSGIIDPLFNLFIFSSLYFFFLYFNTKQWKPILLAAILLGCAVLTKGPVAVLIVALCLFFYAAWQKFKIQFSVLHLFIASLIILLITSIWILPEMLHGGGMALFQEFIAYQIRLFTTSEAGHGQPFYYHFIVLFFGCFPISLLALPTLLGQKENVLSASSFQKTFFLLNAILFWVVLILFSLTTTKIIHYSSLCYFPLSFLAASYLYHHIEQDKKLPRFIFILLVVIGLLFALIFTALPLLVQYKSAFIGMIKDDFVVGNLSFPVYWSPLGWMIGLIYALVLILVFIQIRRNVKHIYKLFFFNILFITIILYRFVPNVERHVQGAYIDFLKAHQHAYVLNYNFKSYAPYFYTDKQMPNNQTTLTIDWLLHGANEASVFLVAKNSHKNEVLEQQPQFSFLYEAGGFIFFERKKIKQ